MNLDESKLDMYAAMNLDANISWVHVYLLQICMCTSLFWYVCCNESGEWQIQKWIIILSPRLMSSLANSDLVHLGVKHCCRSIIISWSMHCIILHGYAKCNCWNTCNVDLCITNKVNIKCSALIAFAHEHSIYGSTHFPMAPIVSFILLHCRVVAW